MVYRGINNNAGGTGIDTSIGGRVNTVKPQGEYFL